jgi:hypothetical protein
MHMGASQPTLLDAKVKVHRNMSQMVRFLHGTAGFIFYTGGKVLLTSSLPGRKL